MEGNFQKLYNEAVQLLHQLTTPHGILASTIEADNYKRIWARDSIVCGIAGLWIQDDFIIEGLKNSLLTLAEKQHSAGMIPSNVLPESDDISFGSLVGRIDATTWFILGSCLYYQHTNDKICWNQLRPAIEKGRQFLKATEYNDKGWIYTPLSGNWADEYPIHGYTLYDNILRLWGEQLFLEITGGGRSDLDVIIQKTRVNFWPNADHRPQGIYQQGAYERALKTEPQHFTAFILPGIYDQRFDGAGNALALLFISLNTKQKKNLSQYLHHLQDILGKMLIPAFWPIITKDSDDWNLLSGNYSYDFKNYSGEFHNGGIWPVWMGLFAYGLSQNGMHEEAKQIVSDFTNIVGENLDWNFQEFFNAHSLKLGGKTQMGYTASGIVFMNLAILS